MVKIKNPLIPARYKRHIPGENFILCDHAPDDGIFRAISDKSRNSASRKNKAARIARKKNRKTK